MREDNKCVKLACNGDFTDIDAEFIMNYANKDSEILDIFNIDFKFKSILNIVYIFWLHWIIVIRQDVFILHLLYALYEKDVNFLYTIIEGT